MLRIRYTYEGTAHVIDVPGADRARARRIVKLAAVRLRGAP